MSPTDAFNFLDVHNGTFTDAATTVIAIFTIVLVLVTGRQAHLTRIAAEAARLSANVAERALTELERPYLVIDVPVPGIRVDTGSGTFSFVEHARWAATNYGRTPALLLDRLTVWLVEAVPAMPHAINPVSQRGPQFPAGCLSSADKPYEETANLMAELPIQEMLDQDAWKTRRIFFCWLCEICGPCSWGLRAWLLSRIRSSRATLCQDGWRRLQLHEDRDVCRVMSMIWAARQ